MYLSENKLYYAHTLLYGETFEICKYTARTCQRRDAIIFTDLQLGVADGGGGASGQQMTCCARALRLLRCSHMKYVLSSEMLLLPGLERTCRRNIPIARDVNLRLSDVRLPAWSPPMGGSGCSGLTRGVRKMVSRANIFLFSNLQAYFISKNRILFKLFDRYHFDYVGCWYLGCPLGLVIMCSLLAFLLPTMTQHITHIHTNTGREIFIFHTQTI